MIVGVKTQVKWIDSITDVPFIGGIFIFILIFIIPVVCSFITQATIPSLHDDMGFTKSLFFFLPVWNLILWFSKIKLYIFFLPAWLLTGGIALVKIVQMYWK